MGSGPTPARIWLTLRIGGSEPFHPRARVEADYFRHACREGDACVASFMDTIKRLRRRMETTAAALEFEKARRSRDRINLLRGGAPAAAVAQAQTDGLARQRPGAMGLGTSRQRVTPPSGWEPPVKPDPLTSGGRGNSRRGE